MKTLKESILTSIGQGDRYFDNILKEYNIDPRKVTWNKDGTIDYDGNIEIRKRDDIETLPFKFNKVSGDFSITWCRGLKSMEGFPKEVGRDFGCMMCGIYSLKGSPEKIGRNCNIQYCNNLSNLKGFPKYVGGGINLLGNENIKNLEGGLPNKVNGYFYCMYCTELQSLKGSPREVGAEFCCSGCNKLKSLKDGPKEVGGDYRAECREKFTMADVGRYCRVKGMIYV